MATIKCPFMLLAFTILNLLWSLAAGISHSLVVQNVTFSPNYLDKLKDNEEQFVNVTFVVHDNSSNTQPLDLQDYQVRCRSSDDSVAEVVHHGEQRTQFWPVLDEPAVDDKLVTMVAPDESGSYQGFGEFAVRGKFIGKVHLACSLLKTNTDSTEAQTQIALGSDKGYSVWVLRSSETLNRIFIGTLIVLVVIANGMMGCDLNLDVVKNVLMKPLAPALGFICQFLLMPLISYAIAYWILFPAGLYSLALGLFTTGCSPGGGASNYWTLLMNGNTDLSITMTFISTVAALVMMPVWMLLLGNQFLADHPDISIQIPYRNIVMSLLSLAVPLGIGILIRRFRKSWADAVRKVLRPFVIFILVFILTFGSYANFYMFYLMTPRVLVAGLLLPWCGFMFGCFASLAFRQNPADVTAIAIETGIQNTGIAIMLLKVSFSQPDADLSSVLPVVASIFTPFPLLTAWGVHAYFRRKRAASTQQENDEADDAAQELAPMSTKADALENGTVVTHAGKKEKSAQPLLNGEVEVV